MNIFETETVKRKPAGTFRVMMWIGLTALGVNLSMRLLQGLSPWISLGVVAIGVSWVWRLISHSGESYTYKHLEALLVIERKLGKSSTAYFSVNLNEIMVIRSYEATRDQRIPSKRRFTVSPDPRAWTVIEYGSESKESLIFEPSENFLGPLRHAVDQVKGIGAP